MSLSDVYRDRYYKPGWVYIQGSTDARLLKFGITLRSRTYSDEATSLRSGPTSRLCRFEAVLCLAGRSRS